MKKKQILTGMISLALLIHPIGASNAHAASTTSTNSTLRLGMRGQAVIVLQQRLKDLGYFEHKVTGYFGQITKTSVEKFQRVNQLKIDGIVGKATLTQLNSDNKNNSIKVSRGMNTSNISTWSWFGKIKDIIPRGTTFKITDVETGKSFYAKRTYGTNHADSETLTKEDTAIMKGLYGQKWSWDRRAIIVEVGDIKLPASMAGMPHGTQFIKDNNMEGHFDVHFLESKTHGTNRVDPLHQKTIQIAQNSMSRN
ncbi:MAG: peptidoglycan-binding domain-containing protein [Thermotaleaceae bacterium]